MARESRSFSIFLSEQQKEQSADDGDADLAGDVRSHRVHEEEVRRIFLFSHLLDDAADIGMTLTLATILRVRMKIINHNEIMAKRYEIQPLVES